MYCKGVYCPGHSFFTTRQYHTTPVQYLLLAEPLIYSLVWEYLDAGKRLLTGQ